MTRAFDAFLLDVDGTLVASNDAHAQAWVDVFREYGHPVCFWQVRRLIGMGGDLVVEHLLDIPKDDRRNRAITDRRGEIFKQRYVGEVTAIEGAHDFVESIDDSGAAVVVATSAAEDELGALLERGGLEELAARAVHADDAENAKPCPDIVLAACAKAGVAPQRAVLIGDTPFDQEAARRAGVAFIAVLTGGWAKGDFPHARKVVPSVADLAGLG